MLPDLRLLFLLSPPLPLHPSLKYKKNPVKISFEYKHNLAFFSSSSCFSHCLVPPSFHSAASPSWCAAAVLCSSRWLTWFPWSLTLPLSLAPNHSVTSPLRPCPPSPPRILPLPPHPAPSTLESWCVKTQTPLQKPRHHRHTKSERIVAPGSACQMWNSHPRWDLVLTQQEL